MTGGMYLTGAVNQLFAVAVLIVLWLTVDAGPWIMLAIGLPVIALAPCSCPTRSPCGWRSGTGPIRRRATEAPSVSR